MAKKKSTPKPTKLVPDSLKKHIQQQQDATLTVSCLLDALIRALAPENGDVVEPAVYSLRHVHKLVDEIHLQLDSVCIANASGVTP